MANPGAWKQEDTNKWKNSKTGDTITIKKKRSVANDPKTRSWKVYMNGRRKKDLSHSVKKDGAVKSAKNLMSVNTVSKKTERRNKRAKKEKVVKEAYQVAKSRSQRATSVDRSQRAKETLDPGDIDDLRKWKNNPSEYDLFGLDTPGATSTLKDIYPQILG